MRRFQTQEEARKKGLKKERALIVKLVAECRPNVMGDLVYSNFKTKMPYGVIPSDNYQDDMLKAEIKADNYKLMHKVARDNLDLARKKIKALEYKIKKLEESQDD